MFIRLILEVKSVHDDDPLTNWVALWIFWEKTEVAAILSNSRPAALYLLLPHYFEYVSLKFPIRNEQVRWRSLILKESYQNW